MTFRRLIEICFIERLTVCFRKMSDANGDYVKQLVHNDEIDLKWIRSGDNASDIFTKPLPHIEHRRFTLEILNLEGASKSKEKLKNRDR